MKKSLGSSLWSRTKLPPVMLLELMLKITVVKMEEMKRLRDRSKPQCFCLSEACWENCWKVRPKGRYVALWEM